MNVTVFQDFVRALPADLRDIIEALEGYGFETRVVGGAVRDIAMGQAPRDIDIATDASPDEITFIMEAKWEEFGLVGVDPRGIRHGTVTVTTSDGNRYEITSLAFSIKEKNGRLVVSRHRDWKADALRRDFTMNSMSLAPDGTLYDYLGGLRDLANQRLRFIGFYKLRLASEPVMAMRFAKLAAKFKDPVYNPSVLKFMRMTPWLLDGIHPDTMAWFMEEIRNSRYPNSAYPILRALGVAPPVGRP